MKYDKQPLSYAEQVDLLVSRGLIVANRTEAETFLSRVNYYRLSAYRQPFEKGPHQFLQGTTFEQLSSLYEFDRKLRGLILEAIEPVEIATRTAVVYRLTHRLGAFAHSNPGNFRSKFDHGRWMTDVLGETERSKETFIEHFKTTYSEYPQLPMWAAVEILSFGSLSKLYGGLQNEDQRAIAGIFGQHHRVFGSWLHTLVYIRNICAHHARLWNRELAIAPKLPTNDPRWRAIAGGAEKKIAGVLLLVSDLQTTGRTASDGGRGWRTRVEAALKSNPGISRFHQAMGLDDDWWNCALWRPEAERE